MRNLKTKGFTLVELIVVIAIIGVLAAVLVPAMLGYMRDSKISQANQNAHAVYTAGQAAITKYATANGTTSTKGVFFTGDDAPYTATNTAVGKDATSDDGKVTLKSFGDYLGDNFIGAYGFKTTATGDAVTWACWCDWEQCTITNAADNAADNDKQVASYKTGTLYGIHPQYPASVA